MAKNSAGLRILVVDDEALIRWAISETLQEEGHAVLEAGTASQAIERVQNGPTPDVILLDFRLPDSDDLALLGAIRRLVPSTAVIMMTAYGTAATLAGALELGAFRVLGKPLDLEDLDPLVRLAHQSVA
jgi:two-component system response regulator AtoC